MVFSGFIPQSFHIISISSLIFFQGYSCTTEKMLFPKEICISVIKGKISIKFVQ